MGGMPEAYHVAGGSESAVDRFDLPLTYDLSQVDPDSGVLVVTTYWRPRPQDPDPERPGEKLTMLSYLPTTAEQDCPCGSGQRFAQCCQALSYWHPLCPNPAMEGYSCVAPQTATFALLSAQARRELRAYLNADERLYCVEDAPNRAFWIHWGDPTVEAPEGMLCFGDIELRPNGALVVGALSERRMAALLDLLRPLDLGTPQLQRDPVSPVEKPPRKQAARRSHRSGGPGRPNRSQA